MRPSPDFQPTIIVETEDKVLNEPVKGTFGKAGTLEDKPDNLAPHPGRIRAPAIAKVHDLPGL